MAIPEFSINRRITIFMVTLIVCIFRIISFSRLRLEMVRYYGYCSNVSQGKRKNKIK